MWNSTDQPTIFWLIVIKIHFYLILWWNERKLLVFLDQFKFVKHKYQWTTMILILQLFIIWKLSLFFLGWKFQGHTFGGTVKAIFLNFNWNLFKSKERKKTKVYYWRFFIVHVSPRNFHVQFFFFFFRFQNKVYTGAYIIVTFKLGGILLQCR